MPPDFLDSILSLMDKQELRRHDPGTHHVFLFLVAFQGQVPESDLLVLARNGEDGGIGWMELDGCDWGLVPVEGGGWTGFT